MTSILRDRAPWILASAGLGALAFVGVQELAGATNIAAFLGQKITEQGSYPAGLAPAIGWGVHLGVSLQYAALFAVLTALPFFPRSGAARLGAGAGLALLLGWVTTLITRPAITVTIALLSGQGLPASVPGLNTTTGLPLWNHVGFFALCFAVTIVARELQGEAARSEAVTATAS